MLSQLKKMQTQLGVCLAHVVAPLYSCLPTELGYKQTEAYLLQAQSLLRLPESVADTHPALAAPPHRAQAG